MSTSRNNNSSPLAQKQLSPPPSPSHTPSTRPGTPARRSPNPRTGTSGGGGARDLLRKHYGLGLTTANASSSSLPLSVPQAKQDPMDLDSPAFDAHMYYSSLISTASLPELLRRENELVGQIRQLEGEKQGLVYNHHHELIAASDTIRAMKKRAESLDNSLDTLKAAFSEISRLGAELSTSDRDRNPPPKSS